MKVFKEIDASDFEEDSWCCDDFWKILHENGLEKDFNALAEEKWPDGAEEVQMNNWIRFDGDSILAMLGYHGDEENC